MAAAWSLDNTYWALVLEGREGRRQARWLLGGLKETLKEGITLILAIPREARRKSRNQPKEVIVRES